MKIKPEHYQTLKTAATAMIKAHPNVRDSYREAGYSDKRYRWDLLHASVGSTWVCRELYPYLDDTHIDTALRRILAEVQA